MKKKTNKELRNFGLTLAIGFAILGSILFWKEKPAGPYLLYVAAAFLVSGLILPRILSPIEWLWMKFAHALGFVMTNVLLTLTFYLMITPIGLLMKILGKDPLYMKFDEEAQSYWTEVEPDGPTSRADKPY